MANEHLRIENISKTTDAILNSMLECGIQNTTKEKISRITGISMASIARYYPTKTDMVMAAIKRLYEKQNKISFDRSGNGQEQLRNFLDALLDEYIEFPKLYNFRMDILCYSHYSNDNVMLRFINSMGYRKVFRDLVLLGIKDGSFNPDTDIDSAVELCCDLIFGQMSNCAMAEGISNYYTEYRIRTSIELIYDAVVEGLVLGTSLLINEN